MSKEARAWFQVFKSMITSSPSIVLAGFIQGIIEGVRPFIAIYYSALIIDKAYHGSSAGELIRYAITGGLITMILSLIHSFVIKIFNQNMESMHERQAGPLSKKSMQMDYEFLEDSHVHKLREEVAGFMSWFGLIGIELDNMYHFMACISTFICAIIILIPKLVLAGKAATGFTGSLLCSALFFLLFVILNAIHIKIINKINKKKDVLYDEHVEQTTKKNFYMNLFAKADSQKDMIMCNQKQLVEREIDAINEKAADVMKRTVKLNYISAVSTNSVSTISTVLAFLFAAVYGYLGIISIGSVVSFAASIKLVAEQMYALAIIYGDFKYQGICALKYMEFLNLNQRKHVGTIPMEKRQDNKFTVEFENVSFKYPGASNYVIKDLNLKFVVGEKLAIVGKNGSGKTTFIKLLCRLYDVTEGCIKVNGIDIRKYDYKEYCQLFGAVFQDFEAFSFTLGETLACDTDVNKTKAEDALSRAGMRERLEELPEGLSTYVGKSFDESGVNFSGGEKQKIAIARAIYKDAPFVMMDEPTAALDPEAEAEVFEGFDKMVGKKTAIYISHRLASCKFCEDILVFDKGKVVQHGSHESLQAEEGLYRKLWEAQAQYYA